jgi:hypothetical protein
LDELAKWVREALACGEFELARELIEVARDVCPRHFVSRSIRHSRR